MGLNGKNQASDKYAAGTSEAMAYYLDVWSASQRLWDDAAGETHGETLVGGRLMHRRLEYAPFDYNVFYPNGTNELHSKVGSTASRLESTIARAMSRRTVHGGMVYSTGGK